MSDSIRITCPYCGERFEAFVDTSTGDADYVEDCPVCCRPIELSLSIEGDDVSLRADRDS
ncbi:MAG: CPXCG motif-containing cysteine-rich protein [Lysobacteraceae bacterium]